jgi:hypothetical protein
MRCAPATTGRGSHRGTSANLTCFIIQTIEELNSWQFGLLLAIAVWEELYALR